MSLSKLAIVGAGPIGLVQAIYLKDRGFLVEVYEAREDIRRQDRSQGRSINITLSERGIRCLSKKGIGQKIMDNSVKVHSRMIHDLNGDTTTQSYGKNGECLFSVNRSLLNELLLEEAEINLGIPVHFGNKITKIDLKKKKLTFTESPRGSHVEVSAEADFIFGCDGVNSVVRKQMKADGILTCEPEEIEHQYKELHLAASPEGGYKLDPNFLHVWPRGERVLLGLPNKDGTFTMSLFMPRREFQGVKDDGDLISLFESLFPDALDLIGRKNLTARFFERPTGSLKYLKCPHYATDGAVLLGDAAHAVVPFYGQGTNAGFEDCFLFDQFLEDAGNDLERASQRFSSERPPDAHALADMSLEHYNFLCKKVDNPLNKCQRLLENYFSETLPCFFPTYTMVAFTDMPYSKVEKQSQWQASFINDFLFLVNILESIFFILMEIFQQKLHKTITA